MKRRFQIGFLTARGLRREDRLLDLGCGTLRGGIPLIDYLAPGHYTGIDVRPEAIAEARKELAESGLAGKAPLLLAEPDLSAVSLPQRVDVAWAFSVLIHMQDDILDGALEFVSRHLDGTFYANVNIGEREPAGWQGFPVVWRPLAFYQARAAGVGLSARDIGALGELGHRSGVPAQDAQRMLAFAPLHAEKPPAPVVA